MNKAELIRAISKRAGIPDANAKLFFEVLLKRLSDVLHPGQAADFPGIGFLQLRKGKLQTNDKTETDQLIKENLNLIVYYENADEPDSKNIIFNIPEIESHPKDSIEQSFSLSIGKPVIPLKGVNENDYFIPLTGKELKDLVSSRVEILLSEINISRNYAKGSEVLLITPTKFSRDQFEIKWDDLVDDKVDTFVEKSIDDKKSVEKIEWEFGSELSKEIDEESILDVNKEEISLVTPKEKKTEDGNIGWNFGITQEDILPTYEEKTKEIISEKLESEKIQAAEVTENIEEENKSVVTDKIESEIDKDLESSVTDITEPVIKKDKTITEEEPEYQKIDTLYERLKAEKKIDTDEFDLSWSFGETLEIEKPEKEIKEVIKPQKHFPDKPVAKDKSDLPKLIITKSIADEILEDKIEAKKVHVDDEISKDDKVIITKIKPTITGPTVTKDKITKEKTTKKTTSSTRTRTYQHTGRYSKKGTFIPFFIGIFVIITVGVLLLSYFTDINLDFLNLSKKDSPATTKTLFAGTNFIERNYDIPVSFNSDKKIINIVQESTSNIPVVKSSPKKSKIVNPPVKKNSEELKLERIKALRETMKDVVKATKNKELKLPAKDENKTTVEPTEQFTFENLPDPIDTVKLNPNIFVDGTTYSVQVSSWQSLATAESEAAKFKTKGYDAYVAEALIPGKGIWYRVRVRNFSSEREAEDFLQLYQ